MTVKVYSLKDHTLINHLRFYKINQVTTGVINEPVYMVFEKDSYDKSPSPWFLLACGIVLGIAITMITFKFLGHA
jgi:hypothetical protein